MSSEQREEMPTSSTVARQQEQHHLATDAPSSGERENHNSSTPSSGQFNKNNSATNYDSGCYGNNPSDTLATDPNAFLDTGSEPRPVDGNREECLICDVTLETLPSEIFLHICSFIDARFLINTLSQVCHSFYYLIMDDKFWKIRIAKRWPSKYPAIPVSDREFDWKEACIYREEQYDTWSNYHVTMDRFEFRQELFAAVDCVHFMKDSPLLAVGSRDRYLNVVNTDKLVAGDDGSVKEAQIFSKMDAHAGWIWCADSLDSTLATGSWDCYIKFWDMAAGGVELRKVKCKSAVLCCHYEPGYFLAGCYDKKVYHIDPRACGVLSEKRYHRQPILSMAVDEQYILTASEDKTIAVYDRRADQVLKTLEMEEFVMCMSYGTDQLWLGDKKGQLHLVDTTDGDFNLVQSYDVGHTGKMTGVIHSLGSIITCNMDKTVRVLQPTLNPQTIAKIQIPHEMSGIATHNATLAVACTDACVRIWKPKAES